MPDHAPTGVIVSYAAQTGGNNYAIPAGTRGCVVFLDTIPPAAHQQVSGTITVLYGVGHWVIGIPAYPGVGHQPMTGSGPLRFRGQYISLVTGHETQLRLYVPPGGVYSVYMVN